jgi:hypothetical protein
LAIEAINPTAGEEGPAMLAAVRRMSDICNEWKDSRCLRSTFGVTLVRERIAFNEYIASLTEQLMM